MLQIIYFNVRSLLPKISELQLLYLTENPNVVCVTETRLDVDVDDCEIEIPGYLCCRLDRNRHDGGLITYFKNTMDYKCVLSGPNSFFFYFIMGIAKYVLVFCIVHQVHPHLSLTHCTILSLH